MQIFQKSAGWSFNLLKSHLFWSLLKKTSENGSHHHSIPPWHNRYKWSLRKSWGHSSSFTGIVTFFLLFLSVERATQEERRERGRVSVCVWSSQQRGRRQRRQRREVKLRVHTRKETKWGELNEEEESGVGRERILLGCPVSTHQDQQPSQPSTQNTKRPWIIFFLRFSL